MARKIVTPTYEVAICLKDKGAHEEALQVARKALTSCTDTHAGAQLNNLVCWLLDHPLRRHCWEAIWCGERAVALAKAGGDSQLLAGCLLNYGSALTHMGQFDTAGDQFRAIVDLNPAPGDAAAAHANLAWLDQVAGRDERALEHLHEAECLARSHEPPLIEGVLVRKASSLMALGRLAEAGLALQEAAERSVGSQGADSPLNFLHRLTFHQMASPYTYRQGTVVLVAFARLNFLQGDVARAHKILSDITTMTEDKGDQPVLAECYALRALLYQAEGGLAPARAYAQRAAQAAVQSNRLDIKALLARDLANLLQGGDLW